jgi:hypothetical protein
MTTTGNSSFRKIRNAEGSDGLNLKGSTVGTLVVDTLIADLILPGEFGSNFKTITGYTATDFINAAGGSSTWLNTTAGRINATSAASTGVLILPEGSRVLASVATTPDTNAVSTGGLIGIGTQAFGTLAGAQSDIFDATSAVLFTLPGCDVGGGTNSASVLGTSGGKVPKALDPTVGNTGVTVTTTSDVNSGSLVVTIYYV